MRAQPVCLCTGTSEAEMNSMDTDFASRTVAQIIPIINKYKITDPEMAEAISDAFYAGCQFALKEMSHETAS